MINICFNLKNKSSSLHNVSFANRRIDRTNQSDFKTISTSLCQLLSKQLSKLLFITQIAINSKVSNTTKVSSYFVNKEQELNLFERKLNHISTDLVMNRVKKLKNNRENIQNIYFKSEKYINRKRKRDFQLKEEDKVYFLTKNLTTKRSTKKLNYITIEPFFIKAVKKSISYKLSLFKNTHIYLIFHINLLESIDSNIFIQKNFHFEDSKEKYIVKRILDRKDQKNLVKRKNYSYTDNTWESFKNLTECQKLLWQFHQ